MPIHTKPLSWQLEHPPVMPVWICAVVGAGVAKALPGGFRAAFAGTSPPGTLARWQLSQVVDDGMCEFAPIGEVAGMTTMLVMPAKLLPEIVGPWQVTQPLTMPEWFICPPPKVVKPLCVEATWQVLHGAASGVGM